MNDRNESEFNQAAPYQAPRQELVPEKKSGSCLLYGCLASIAFVLILVIGGGLGGYWFVKGQVTKYTSDEPADLPIVEVSDEELTAIEERVENFKDLVEKDEAPEDLVLTADEINALISKNDDLKGRVYATIREGQVSGEVSIPTDFAPGGKGRYFNAMATFNVSLDNGVLIVTLTDATVKGEKVPQQVIEGLGKQNLAKDIYKDPKVAEIFRRFDRLTIEEDKIILTPRLASKNTEDTEADTAERVPSENTPTQDDDELPKVEETDSLDDGEASSGDADEVESPAQK